MIEAAIVAARWVFFLSATIVFGTVLFPFYAWPGAQPPAGFARRALIRGSVVCLAAAFAWFMALTLDFGGAGAALATASTILFRTRLGLPWAIRLLTALALVVATILSRRPNPVLLLLAASVLAVEGWFGHSAVGGTIHHVVQMVHVLAVGAWLGGLLPLARALSGRGIGAPNDDSASRIVRRFSATGIASVSLIVISGVANTWFIAGSPAPFLGPNPSGEYDRVLLLKIALFLGMVGVALYNRLYLLPRLGSTRLGRNDALARLRGSVFVEQALGLIVLAAAALLGNTPPPGP